MSLLDFDYLIISNQRLNTGSLQDTLFFFHELGIRTVVLTVRYNRERYTPAYFFDRLRTLKEEVRNIRPRGMNLVVCPEIQMTDGIAEDSVLSRLRANRSEYLFINLPLFHWDDRLDADLNRILFQKHLCPIFTGFESNMKTNSPAQLERLARSRSFIGCFDLVYLTSLSAHEPLIHLLLNDTPILPCISHDLSDYAGVIDGFHDLKNRIGNKRYVDLCRTMQRCNHEIIARIANRSPS